MLALNGALPEGDPLRTGVTDAYEKQLNAQTEAQAAQRRAARRKKSG